MNRAYFGALMLVMNFACDSPDPLVSPERVSQGSLIATSQTADRLRELSRGLATAMANPLVRADVRDAMRSSPWGQHVIDLGSFLASPTGKRTATGMAAALRITNERLLERVNSADRFDLYIPAREMRRTWRAGANIAVFASMDVETSDVVGYAVGRQEPNHQSDDQSDEQSSDDDELNPADFEAIFLLEPTGRRIPRYDRDPGDDSTVVEGPDEIDVRYTFIDEDGVKTVLSYEDFIHRDPTPSPEGPSLAPSSNGDTDIDRIWVTFCDGGGLSGDLELVLESRFFDESGHFLGMSVWEGSHDGPTSGFCNEHYWVQSYYPEPSLISFVLPPGASHYIRTEMWEDDVVDDDFIGVDSVFALDTLLQFGSNYPANCGKVSLHFDTLSTSTFSMVRLADVILPEDEGPVYREAIPADQYGFGLDGYSTATGWGTGNSTIATASSYGGLWGTVSAVGQGTTTFFATVSGIQGTGTVSIEEGGDAQPPHDTTRVKPRRERS